MGMPFKMIQQFSAYLPGRRTRQHGARFFLQLAQAVIGCIIFGIGYAGIVQRVVFPVPCLYFIDQCLHFIHQAFLFSLAKLRVSI